MRTEPTPAITEFPAAARPAAGAISRERAVRDSEASGYDQGQVDGKGASFIALQRRLLMALVETAPPGPVLDAGCGTGLFTGALLGSGREVVAVDFSGESLRVLAGKRLPTAGSIQADVTRLPLADHAFGAVVANLVLQHIPKAGRALALAELRRCLVPGGVGVFTVYNRALFDRRGEAPTGEYDRGQPYFSFSHMELRAELQAAGFVDCQVRPLGLGLYVRNLPRGGWRLYRLMSPALNRVEGLAHPYLPSARAYPSEYWIASARKSRF
jgi:ubiquinone/menaquinone biosynthesis C-methylase UbiE